MPGVFERGILSLQFSLIADTGKNRGDYPGWAVAFADH
jgi:hypothetical protein